MIRVWDLAVRVFHWSLVLSVTAALVTGMWLLPTWITLHLIGGTVAAVLVVGRILWGFWGPGPARFSAFVHGPRKLMEHTRELVDGKAPRHIGHNPLGGAMVVALFVVILLLALTGVVAEGGVLKAGPLAFATTYSTGWSMRQIHNLFAYLLLLMVILHLGGVVFESWRSRENLARAMVDGEKEPRPGDVPPPKAPAHPVLAGSVAAVLLVAGTGTVYALAQKPGLGVPKAPMSPLYVKQCSDCHIPYHPSLAPASTWTAIMADLSHHFGQDASLDPKTVSKLTAYLVAHSAGHYDTLPANRLRMTDPAEPLKITAAPFWQRIHRHIPAAVFKAKSVVSKANCQACHADAKTGMFAPSQISIPESAEP